MSTETYTRGLYDGYHVSVEKVSRPVQPQEHGVHRQSLGSHHNINVVGVTALFPYPSITGAMALRCVTLLTTNDRLCFFR
ncbi:MAG: hypothetical protein JRJ66_11500 [Deltaproteobacteria bacterium]|nr:hypothetical protein [Deltaproteobacteria bacterium]